LLAIASWASFWAPLGSCLRLGARGADAGAATRAALTDPGWHRPDDFAEQDPEGAFWATGPVGFRDKKSGTVTNMCFWGPPGSPARRDKGTGFYPMDGEGRFARHEVANRCWARLKSAGTTPGGTGRVNETVRKFKDRNPSMAQNSTDDVLAEIGRLFLERTYKYDGGSANKIKAGLDNDWFEVFSDGDQEKAPLYGFHYSRSCQTGTFPHYTVHTMHASYYKVDCSSKNMGWKYRKDENAHCDEKPEDNRLADEDQQVQACLDDLSRFDEQLKKAPCACAR